MCRKLRVIELLARYFDQSIRSYNKTEELYKFETDCERGVMRSTLYLRIYHLIIVHHDSVFKYLIFITYSNVDDLFWLHRGKGIVPRNLHKFFG